jgi:diaminohydroxyphosphoribosylaminopyrimidine deaminase / 5-amino-6-(5-phosphoribosylamino)uracil reductase
VADAVAVGSGTVLADDPLLTVRLDGLHDRSPVRIVVDPFARTPPDAGMLAERAAGRVMILTTEKALRSAVEALRDRGASVHPLSSDYKGRFDPREIVRFLGVTGFKSVLLEGGAETARRFLEAQLVDRIALFTSRKVIGEGGIVSPVTLESVPQGYMKRRSGVFGDDVLTEFERRV